MKRGIVEIDSSFRSILRVAIPMILTALSTNLMYFVDRSILAGYSADAMYAAIASGSFVSTFTYLFIGIARTSGVFVGQFNGSKQYDKLAIPAWQMIYISLISEIVFFPMGYYSEYINFLPEYAFSDGVDYQRPLFFFGFIPVMIAGLSAFFIGQGKTYIITFVVLFGNILNGVLSYILVYKFGKGAFGAAIGTVIAQAIQVIILAVVFLNKNNRLSFGTLKNFAFNKKIFFNCFKVGAPISMSNFFGIFAWYLIMIIVGYASRELGIIWGIGTNIYILTAFFAEGLNEAIASIASNMIGNNDIESVKKVYKRFVLLVVWFVSILSIPMVIFPEMGLSILNILKENIENLRRELTYVFIFSLVSLILESLEFITWGVLEAGGDTRYPVIVMQVCLWTIMVIPTGIMCYLGKLSSVCTVYGFMVSCFFITFSLIYRRYKSLKWYNKLV